MNVIDQIKIIPNFMSDNDINKITDYMLTRGPKHEAVGITFGHDLLVKEEDRLFDLNLLKDIKEFIIKEYFPKVIKTLQDQYNDKSILYPSVFWIIRSTNGSSVHEHVDGEGNPHFKYSSIFYLDTISKDGVLEFPKINYNYQSKRGDMLLFPAQDEEFDHVVKKISSTRHTVITWFTEDPELSLI